MQEVSATSAKFAQALAGFCNGHAALSPADAPTMLHGSRGPWKVKLSSEQLGQAWCPTPQIRLTAMLERKSCFS